MFDVSACKNQTLLRGVWSLTPLRTTKNMKRTAVDMRTRDPRPIPLPVGHHQQSGLECSTASCVGALTDSRRHGVLLALLFPGQSCVRGCGQTIGAGGGRGDVASENCMQEKRRDPEEEEGKETEGQREDEVIKPLRLHGTH